MIATARPLHHHHSALVTSAPWQREPRGGDGWHRWHSHAMGMSPRRHVTSANQIASNEGVNWIAEEGQGESRR